MTGEKYKFSDIIPMKLMGVSGVYAIRNVVSGKCYIGSTKNLFKRLHHHRAALRHGDHRNCHMQRSFEKHGDDAFVAEILDLCQESELFDRERQALIPHKDSDMCFNVIRFTIEGPRGQFPEESKRRIREGAKRYWQNPINRARQSAKLTGRKQSPEHTAKTVAIHVMEYDLTHADGRRHVGINRALFCRQNGLRPVGIFKVIHGVIYSYKGWRLTTPISDVKPQRKVSESDVVEIRRAVSCGEISRREAADRFRVGVSAIDCIVARQTWKRVP